MKTAAIVLVGVVGLLHFYFMALEMFFWKKPLGLKAFNNTAQKAKDTAVLAANQGLYNGFLAAGLFWGLTNPVGQVSNQIQFFFLICITTAGIYGAITVNKKIFFIQALPAVIAMFLLMFA